MSTSPSTPATTTSPLGSILILASSCMTIRGPTESTSEQYRSAFVVGLHVHRVHRRLHHDQAAPAARPAWRSPGPEIAHADLHFSHLQAHRELESGVHRAIRVLDRVGRGLA